MKRRIAILNQKGGVGKTTTAANLGAALAKSGSRVLLIDLDPQGHLSLHFGVELQDGELGVYDVLTQATPLLDTAHQVQERLTLIPADIDLAGAESELVSVTGREVLLREAVDAVADDFDYMLIDCPPSLGILAINALVACNEVIIPLQAQFFALQGLSKLLETMSLVRKRINPQLIVSGVVLCMHEATTRLAAEIVDDLSQFLEQSRGTGVAWESAKLFSTCIRRNIKLAEAASFAKTVFDYAPRSNGAVDYTNLTIEIFNLPTNAMVNDTNSKQPVTASKPEPSTSAQESSDVQIETEIKSKTKTKTVTKSVSKPKSKSKPKQPEQQPIPAAATVSISDPVPLSTPTPVPPSVASA